MSIQELIDILKNFPPEMEVWGFDYVDNQGYPIIEARQVEPNDKYIKCDNPVLILK
jgi:hypothetical protein